VKGTTGEDPEGQTMGFGYIVDQLHDENSFANTSTTKQPNLSTSLVRAKRSMTYTASKSGLHVTLTIETKFFYQTIGVP
jgi:hypothetical protein